MTAEVIPNIETLPDNIDYQLTEHGGHVGFVGGSLKHPQCGWNSEFQPGFPPIWSSSHDHSLATSGQ